MPPLGFAIAPTSTEESLSGNALGPINAFVPIDRYGIRGQNQIVAIFDTGVDAGHPDLTGRILATEGFNEGSDTRETIAADPDGDAHGTAVSSLITGGIGPNLQVEGVAPDAQIVPVQLSEDRFGDFDRIDDTHLAPAVAYVSGLGNVHVINNSWNFVGLSIGQYEQQIGHTLAADF
ncbi:MAG: S8 family serine peptidase, partial [Stellaceae bacterium]